MPEHVVSSERKKPYLTPRIVDFGSIEDMTGDCWGPCEDGMNGGQDWDPTP